MRIPPVPADVRERVINRDMWVCAHLYCLERSTELAHKIAQTRANVSEVKRIVLEEYGAEVDDKWVIYNVIHHPRNLACSCRKHNDSFNIGNRPEVVRAHVRAILDGELRRETA